MGEPAQPSANPSFREELAHLHASVLDGLRLPLTAAPLLVGLFAGLEFRAGRGSPWLVLHVLDSAAVAAMVWWRGGPLRVRRFVLTAAVTLSAGWVLLHYGPLMGAGIFFMAAAMGGAFFYGRRGVVAVTATLLAFVLLSLAAPSLGLPSPATALMGRVGWVRLAVASGVLLAVCGYLFERVHRLGLEALATALAAGEEMARAAQEREQLHKQAVSAQRLEVVGRLAGGVAHEINNALAGVLTNAELLSRSASIGAEDKRLLEDVSTAGKHAASVAKALLAFARPRPEDKGSVSPFAALEGLATAATRMLGKGVQVRIDAARTDDIPLSASAFEQVLANLALNARDAMPSGGQLLLACRDTPEGLVEVSVADDGAGMPEEVRERAWEPFFSTRQGATGLGLSMVWGIVTRAGGTVALDSKLGVGTRVSMSFPRVAPAVVSSAPAAAAAPEPKPKPKRVLLLEDDALVRRAFTRMLEAGGFHVASFERAAPAARAASAVEFDALVTDATVPEGGVQSLIDAFRSAHAAAPILVCSGHLEEEMVKLGIERGEYRFLRKPVAMKELLDALS